MPLHPLGSRMWRWDLLGRVGASTAWLNRMSSLDIDPSRPNAKELHSDWFDALAAVSKFRESLRTHLKNGEQNG